MKKIAFTLVLNGMPFIKRQAEIIPEVFDYWFIVEGATLPIYDTSWCKNIDNQYFSDKKLSVDGTTEYLDSIASDKIIIVRKNDFWNGKIEMCNCFMEYVENAYLMEIDVDEFWSKETLVKMFEYCDKRLIYDGCQFKCNYYVGPDLIIANDGFYGNQDFEWNRLWKIKDKTTWASHEPPVLHGYNKIVDKKTTMKLGWVFDHYAYVLESQLQFKQNFYGYENAVADWKRLQAHTEFPTKLKDFLPWVDDGCIVTKTDRVIQLP